MRLIILRHCEPDYVGNDKDFGLSETGKSEAAEIAKKLGNNIDIIISSPLKRAIQTANIIGESLNIRIVIENDLREWESQYGIHTESIEGYRNMFSEFVLYKGKRNSKCIYWWEDIDSLGERLFRVIAKYRLEYQTCLIVGHKMLFGQLVDTRNMKFGEYYEFEFVQSHWNGFVEKFAKNKE